MSFLTRTFQTFAIEPVTVNDIESWARPRSTSELRNLIDRRSALLALDDSYDADSDEA